MAQDNEVNVTAVTDDAGFAELREQWNALADAAETGTVFLQHEWFDAAWQWLAVDCERLILRVTRADRLVGIWPLVIRRRTQRKIDVKVVEFMTVPDTQVCDTICAPEDHAVVVGALFEYLRSHPKSWDVVELNKLPSDSRTVAHFEEARGGGRAAFDITDDGSNPQINLGVTWPDYYATRSRRLKKGNNLVANRLKKKFDEIDMRWIRAEGADEKIVSDTLQTAIELSGRSWKRETGNSLDHSGPNAFIRRLTAHALTRGWLSIWLLELDGKPAAMEYQLTFRGDIHALRGDFDDEFSSDSPGTFLNWRILERLFDEGQTCYHMGPGDNAYKLRWAEQAPALSKVTVYGRSVRGQYLSIVERSVRPFAATVVGWAKARFARRD